ncbi:YciI family protein [Polyangium spumosum]|uniref:Dehydrogenase n=1 Tax=Polyangium spumosum TaxID=889282 RepID=A0A6N7PYC4_9BACT|nr:YciI family protein [Polyangium spumosum]MRG93741.1 dehydrogenase [Polyangium spumosum]
MRFMICAAPDPNAPKTEGAPPSEELIARYMKFNEDMTKAGVLVTAEGVNPGREGARVGVKGGKRVVLDGPFVETKELVGGFYLIDVNSREEAIEWALRCPTGIGHDDILTILPMTDADDLPPEMMAIIEKVAPTWVQSFSKKK